MWYGNEVLMFLILRWCISSFDSLNMCGVIVGVCFYMWLMYDDDGEIMVL